MVKYFTIFILSFFMLLSPLTAFADDDGVIGTILEVEGSANVTSAAGATTAAAINTPVHMNDVVQTAAASRVFIQFIDNTELTLSENTQARVDDYVFDADDKSNNKASYSVLQGAFQYVSGLIGKRENPDVHIDTPVGSIGIRGTDFWAGNLDGQYNVAVNEGQVALKTDAGEEVVNKGEGTSVQDRRSRPAPAQAWSREKFQRLSATVRLRRHDMVRKRVNMMKQRNRYLRLRYKNYMKRQRRQGRGEQQQYQRQYQQGQYRQEPYQQRQGQQQERRRAWQKQRRARLREQRREEEGRENQ